MELKKIEVLSLAKIAALFGIVYGLIMGLLVALLVGTGQIDATELGIMAELGYAAIAVLPLIYAIIYFVFGSITALIYNLISKKVGGIKIDLKK